jgi:NAD(P)-dependent dehydrogenase (short-subunit alcohol dehydrogenase family)
MGSGLAAGGPATTIRPVDGRSALVTGSTSGIGRAVALALAAGGADLLVHGRDQARGEAVTEQVRQLGRRAVFVPAELRDPASCAPLVATAVAEFGRLDVLVNNAAAVLQAPTEQTGEAALDELFAVNVRAPYLLVQAALPHLREGGGVVVNITGSPAYRGAPASSAYAATKAALHSLTRSWAAELGPLGIRVNEISPGATDTPLSRRTALADPQRRSAIIQRVPARRIGEPDDIAAAVTYLVSDQAGYVNGTTLAVDGGLLA